MLETGFGWGTLAIELVKRTGCKYTGITLSQEQLKFAEERVNKAGLQVNWGPQKTNNNVKSLSSKN